MKKQSKISRTISPFIDIEQGTICRQPTQQLNPFLTNKVTKNALSIIVFMILFGLAYLFFSTFIVVVTSPIDLISEESSFLPKNEPIKMDALNSVLTVNNKRSIVNPHPTRLMPQIDIVYSYVNGSDPSRLKAKLDFIAAERENQFSEVDFENVGSLALSRDNNELLYSLRSVSQYFKWFRGNIYIVSDQTPQWLNTSHPQIHLVRSEDIMDEADQPTFNSHAIEASLHKIEGLSEYFLYFNDDYLLGADVPQSYYLRFKEDTVKSDFPEKEKNDEPQMCMSFYHDERETIPGDSQEKATIVHYAAMKNVNALLDKKFKKKKRFFLPHAPHLFQRSGLERISKDFSKDFAITSSSRFRSWNNIHSAYLFANYMVEDDQSCSEFRKMKNKCFFNSDYCIKLLRDMKDTELFFLKVKTAKIPWRFMSINDHVPDDSPEIEGIMQMMADYLEWKYPAPSPWEKMQ
eukprot:TRINITY_DN12406_c0_g1_i1.p1 TRINITY_DN12406_c0_g1~~TRINITY_DN12406_c0_g1_i1.p1  ORF type:complete len:462 (-),score=69.76 TRINITY_DN12406_c0_g1_i1:99-1484(-)